MSRINGNPKKNIINDTIIVPMINTVSFVPNKNVLVEVVYSEYEDYDLENPILPSRGTIYRNQDPSTIPYEIDPASIVDSWYPNDLFTGSDPYIIRDVRGMNIHISPFMYNPVQQKIRVYKKITLKVSEDNTPPVNPLPSTDNKVCREMAGIYESMFINYNQNPVRWTQELGEYGEILVIYTSAYATAIQPWITWKKEKGYQVHELSVTTGTNVKTNILTEYNSNNNILYVLLIGDWADIQSDLGSSGNAPTDPMLGCVVGTDDYHDIIIGRFSASSAAHVTTQGNKTITYERDPETGGTWYSQALGIASAEGPGDDGEYDYEQIDNIHDGRLLNFTYTTCNEVYDPGATATQVANYVNNGVSVINYCGHGDHSYWVTSNYSTTNVNSSTNGAKLPFVFSVACIVGEFHTGSDCLAEALLRKDGGGAVAAWMSTINQPWQPPMRGQDYANDILVQGYNYTTGPGNGTSTTYGKTTFGSITFNAGALMVAESSTSSDWDTYKTWTVFGDPSVQVRTEAPKAITLSNYIINPGTYATTVTVGGSPFEGAIVSLYKSGDPQPYSAVTDASGNVSITHPLTGTVKLTVTGFNLDTYSQDHVVGSSSTLIANFSGTPLVIPQGGTVDFTDLSTPTGTIISWDWQFPGAVTTTSTVQNPAGIQYNTPGQYNVSLTVGDGTDTHTETKTNYITVTGPLTANFMGTPTTIMAGQTVDFTDQSAGGGTITNWDWQFPGAVTTASTNQNPAGIQYNNPGTYDVTLTITDDASSTDSETKNAYITVLDPNAFMTDFYASATVIIEGQSVDFFDDTQNGPATSWTWNFGNGQTSSVQNPAAIVYDIPGFYTVTLTSSDGTDTDTETKIDYIEVIDSSYLPIADFTANFTTVMVGGSVDFYDLSQNGPITWDWTFTGADVPTSAIQDPTVITYSTVGVYPVTLAVTNPIGSDTITKTDYITVIDNSSLGPLEADFHATTNRLIIMGETVSFEDLTVGFPTN
ncbi:MAG: C25 family cysteine peptidase, partial [Bacteroidota bacterium]